MENVLLTQEEIDKRNELFRYDMTQVATKLKDEYTKNKKFPSPIDGLDLTEKDIKLNIKFNPPPESELNVQPQNVPLVSVNADFVPLTDVKSAVIYKNNVQGLVNTNTNVDFAPLTDVEISADAIDIPKPTIEIDYKPIQNVKVKLIEHSVPENIYRADPYVPYTSTDIVSEPVDIPSPDVSLAFVPFVAGAIEVQAQDVPKVEMKAVYTPIAVTPINNTLAQDVPVIKVKALYTPLSLEAVDLKTQDIPQFGALPAFIPVAPQINTSIDARAPEMNGEFKYKPRKPNAKIRSVKCPVKVSTPGFKPIDVPVINAIESTIPSINKSFEFVPPKRTETALPRIEAPVLGKIREYKPIKSKKIKATKMSVPNHNLTITYSKEIDVKAPAQITEISYPPVDFAKKDFYAIWEAM